MISALYRYPKSRRKEVGRLWGSRSAESRAANRLATGTDSDTCRQRALDDARGQILRAGCTYSAAGEQHWCVMRSIRGRTNQRDVMINGSLFKTCGPRRLPAWLR